MTETVERAATSEPAPAPRSATPRSPAARELGITAKLLFPTQQIAQDYYLPLIYTACRTCYSELEPQDIFERATDGRVATEKQQDLVRKVIESGQDRKSTRLNSSHANISYAVFC